MFKVSFKDPKDTSKVVIKVGKHTRVTLKGTVNLPAFWKYLPEHISEWINVQNRVDIYEDLSKNQLIVFSKGLSNCHPDDHYDTVLGERLAEARAKCSIYKFFYDLTYKIADYYGTILYGYPGPVVSETKEGLMPDIHKYEELYRHELKHQMELLKNNKDE